MNTVHIYYRRLLCGIVDMPEGDEYAIPECIEDATCAACLREATRIRGTWRAVEEPEGGFPVQRFGEAR